MWRAGRMEALVRGLQLRACWRWQGRRPVGPAAEWGGKERMAADRSSVVKEMFEGRVGKAFGAGQSVLRGGWMPPEYHC